MSKARPINYAEDKTLSDTNKKANNDNIQKQERERETNREHACVGEGRTEAFLNMLSRRGLLDDPEIGDDMLRHATKEKKRRMYHNTQLMLKCYRDINWALECFPGHISEELDRPLNDLDALLNLINSEIDMENAKLENRLMSVKKSRLLLDRFNEALTVLRRKPMSGELMYQSLYLTYITPEKLSHTEILFRLNVSSRHYYRVRQQAVNILSIRLWAAPAGELDAWLEVLTLLDIM
jgi:hypothetical protein